MSLQSRPKGFWTFFFYLKDLSRTPLEQCWSLKTVIDLWLVWLVTPSTVLEKASRLNCCFCGKLAAFFMFWPELYSANKVTSCRSWSSGNQPWVMGVGLFYPNSSQGASRKTLGSSLISSSSTAILSPESSHLGQRVGLRPVGTSCIPHYSVFRTKYSVFIPYYSELYTI